MKPSNYNNSWSHTAAILAGGQSKRMGIPKEGLLLWDNRPMIEHIIGTLITITDKIVIVGECKGYTPPKNIKIIHDSKPFMGPLVGLKSLLESNTDSAYLVVACDQPLITKDLLMLLVKEEPKNIKLFTTDKEFETRNSKLETRIDPFPGYYPSCCLTEINKTLESGNTSMQTFLSNCKIDWVDLPREKKYLIKSINTPVDLKETTLVMVKGGSR